MPDTRSTEEKLEAMANQTASPQEAEIAGRMLASLRARRPQPAPEKPAASQGRTKTRPVVTRDGIFRAPNEVSRVTVVKILWPTGSVVSMFEHEVDWELVETYRMPWRYSNEVGWRHPKGATPNQRTPLT